MKIFDFIRQMAPVFRREDVSEKLRMLRIYLEDQTIPAYENYLTSGIKVKSKAIVEFEKQFVKNVHTQFRGNWAEVTLAVLKNISANLSAFETLADKNYAKDILSDAITFKKAEILRIFAIADFVVTYSRQNMLFLLATEANVEARTLPAGKERPLPELTWLEENQQGYFKSFPVMALKGSELLAALNSIPDIVVNEDSLATSEATIGAVKLDPLASGLIPIVWNPFYALGVRMANRENLRMDRAKAEKRAMEFRLEQLRMQERGENDARLEKTIAFYEQEVNLLASKIAKYEE
jgi:hypothetical protein